MKEIELSTWKGTADYKHFEKGLIKSPGNHLLCVGMTGSGKTMKAIAISKWCLDAGKTAVWFDTWKPDDLNYLLHYTKKATILHPPDCKVIISDKTTYDITLKEIRDPKTLFREIDKGLNIICIRQFIRDTPPFVKYMGDVMTGLIDDAFDKKIKVKPIQIFMDEFQTICPSKRLHHLRSQQMLGSKIVNNLLMLRSIGVGFCAFTQSYRNIMPATRLQFSYYLICKDPDGDLADYIGKLLLRFANLFSKFTPAQGTIIHPNGRFTDIVTWPMPNKDNFEINYEGRVIESEQVGDSIVLNVRVSREEAARIKGEGGIKSLLQKASHT